MFACKSNLKDRIESFIYEKLDDRNYEIVNLKADQLLTWNRLDLAFKLFYLDNKKLIPALAEKVYREDIRSQTWGRFEEIGNAQKDSFEKYKNIFDDTYLSLQNSGFDQDKSLIPLSSEDTITNGAHRVASAIHQNINITCVKLDLPLMTCDYQYFLNKGVDQDILDLVVSKFVEYSNNCYVAFLWNSGVDHKEEALSKFSNVVFKKNVRLNPNGAFNLLYELYKHMDWIGSSANGFQGIQQKLVECFPNFDEFTILVFQSDSLESARKIKEDYREIYNIGFSSIHITDNKKEAIEAVKLMLNSNSIHFLNYAKPRRFASTIKRIELVKEIVKNSNYDTQKVLFDGGMVFAAYGIRESSDIDLFTLDNKQLGFNDEQLEFHDEQKNSLLFNPKFYFYYMGMKFVSLFQTYRMKKNRYSKQNQEKDRNDYKMLEALISDNKTQRQLIYIKQNWLYFRIKLKIKFFALVSKTLKAIGLYKIVRDFYRGFRRK